ncbi:CRISPR-associated protein Cse3 [Acetobacter estunensis NRIC 0472]|uniref:Type I-E CRISPR-associated protein Cas6/Cse3/CasE n=1 Tax=Acetobacter estunensis TaxID=104097 RepID=A0A967B6A0_9PROT|nr:type I-E CRISPR-associated protein Cas6/Cse3/CasE [Acetobacter estunensis]NHO54597.1 type I-E CRISPR-associated protein Cas6/Cse3/CasE [Acetobacter estunensis]GBQ20404.1 CRISPR-associated protein Cse3 [Acetobacter estunensis NRIC 0472]
MSEGFLSRVSLRRDAPVQAIARLLVPEGEGRQHGAAHHLLWTLFGDDAQRSRDFLWRQMDAGRFMVLSMRQPVDAHGLFDIETRDFAPCLKEGSRLRFLLRANATVDRKTPGRARSQRHDVVMDALHRLPSAERGCAREGLVPAVMGAWLERVGDRAGFAPDLETLVIENCDVWRIPRAQGRSQAIFGVVDMTADLTVRAPDIFVPALMRGFGRARAFGCGLMLVRRAS